MKRFLSLSLSLSLLLVGCSKKTTTKGVSDEQYEESGRRGNGSAGKNGRDGRDGSAGDASLDRVLFDFDRSNITASSNEVLVSYSNALINSGVPAGKVMFIDGHADERGTDEYNMALGYRRAASVQGVLLKRLGKKVKVPMELKSYGKHRPYIDEHNEEAYRQNRRVEFYLLDKSAS